MCLLCGIDWNFEYNYGYFSLHSVKDYMTAHKNIYPKVANCFKITETNVCTWYDF